MQGKRCWIVSTGTVRANWSDTYLHVHGTVERSHLLLRLLRTACVSVWVHAHTTRAAKPAKHYRDTHAHS